MTEELSAAEIARLKDMDAFNASIAATGWQVREKIIWHDLSRIRLSNSVIAASRVVNVKWRGAFITNTRFIGVEFILADFGGARLSNVVFEDCIFSNSILSDATFDKCHFRRCRSENLEARNSIFDHCHFEILDDKNGVFGGSKFRESSFSSSKLANTSIRVAELIRVAFRGTELRLVVFSELTGTNLMFEDSALFNCGFSNSGEYGDLGFARSRLRGVTFDAFHLERAFIRNSPSIEELVLLNCNWRQSILAECPQVAGWRADRCQLRNWNVTRSQIAWMKIRDSEIAGECIISDCELADVNLFGSSFSGLRILRTVIHESLNLENARFIGLTLDGVTYRNTNSRFPKSENIEVWFPELGSSALPAGRRSSAVSL